jgi:hypothetical protein
MVKRYYCGEINIDSRISRFRNKYRTWTKSKQVLPNIYKTLIYSLSKELYLTFVDKLGSKRGSWLANCSPGPTYRKDNECFANYHRTRGTTFYSSTVLLF